MNFITPVFSQWTVQITFVSKPVQGNANQSYKNIDWHLRFVYQCSILDHGLFDEYALYWSVCFVIF